MTSQEEQETIINAQNIVADHSYTMQEQLKTQKFEFLKHKISGDITVGHLNVEKYGVLKRRELGTMLKSLDIDLLSIVEHHVPMEETEKMATAVKNCHSLLIPGYGSCLCTYLYHQEELDGITRNPSMSNHGT